jgi:glycosyltransferase involved in cell wall biosynthesis
VTGGSATPGDGAPAVTVVVPVRDGAGVIGPCVESLLALDYPPDRVEIVVIDNGSIDGTRAALERFSGRIRVGEEARPGPSAARNAGIQLARGDLVAFTDADCVVHPSWLRELIRAQCAEADVVGGRILALPDAGLIAHFGERVHDHRVAIEGCHPPYLITMNLLVPAAALAALGGFDERLLRGEDVDLAYRLRAHGHRFAYAHEAVVFHRNRDTLTRLAREGWLHGLHKAPVARLHGAMLRELWDTTPPPPGPAPRSEYSRPLEPWRERLLWIWFRTAKRLGRMAGTLRGSPR